MAQHVTLRFMEVQRYDPMIDVEVIRFMGVTNKGTFHTEVPIDGPVSLRTKREAFKEYVLTALENGESPREVTL